jgi:uncharacterized membrane protein YdfJ with MMPL/SSD domain
MPALTRFVLRHKALVALLWLAVTVAGVVTVAGTTHRLTNNFFTPARRSGRTARSRRSTATAAPTPPTSRC